MVQENPRGLEEDLPQTPEPQPIGLSPPTTQPITEQGCAPVETPLQLYIVFLSLHISVPSLPGTFGFSCRTHRGWSLYHQKQQGHMSAGKRQSHC